MSWGERSCLRPCRCPESCKMSTCNVNCSDYIWDGITEPDAIEVNDDSLPNITGMTKKGINKIHSSGLSREERRKHKKLKMIKRGSDGKPIF